MLDVHPPHEAAHSWRDFSIHISTIVVGLLIAISLEQSVEWFHHRHLLHTAETTLHIEIEQNRRTLSADTQALASEKANLTEDLALLRELREHPGPLDAKAAGAFYYEWSWDGLGDAAWTSARDTGALSLMNYEQVQRYSNVYTQQRLVTDAVNVYIAADSHIGAQLQVGRTIGQLSPQELDQTISACGDALIDLELLQALIRPMDGDYAKVIH